MDHSLDIFLTESNVDLYLSRLHRTWEVAERDRLVTLLIQEESKMGVHREHVQRAEERVKDGQIRVASQRRILAELSPEQQSASTAAALLETLEKTLDLLEHHLACMQSRMKRL